MKSIAEVPRLITAVVLMLALSGGVARACAVPDWPDPKRALNGELVVIGNVRDVMEVVSADAKARYQAWLAANPDRPPGEGQVPLPYLRFTLEVVEVIKGRAPSEITVTWSGGLNNGYPRNLRGGYLMVLAGPTTNAVGGPPIYRVTNSVCTAGMVYRRGDHMANAVRELFGRWPEPLEAEHPSPGEIWKRSWPTIVLQSFLGLGGLVVACLLFWPRRWPRVGDGSRPRRLF